MSVIVHRNTIVGHLHSECECRHQHKCWNGGHKEREINQRSLGINILIMHAGDVGLTINIS